MCSHTQYITSKKKFTKPVSFACRYPISVRGVSLVYPKCPSLLTGTLFGILILKRLYLNIRQNNYTDGILAQTIFRGETSMPNAHIQKTLPPHK